MDKAIDIIATKQLDSEIKIGPVHVRFTKLLLFNYNSMSISITIDGNLLQTKLKITPFGDGYIDNEVSHISICQELKNLNLSLGKHEVEFRLDDNIVKCELHLFDYTDKIAISDVDGTITKSDVKGFVYNVLNKDYTHAGVAMLYTKLEQSGIKLIYLSARAMNFKPLTVDYIKGINQDGFTMPNGPVLTTPDGVVSNFFLNMNKEDIEKFKADTMRAVFELFKDGQGNFVCGFGNHDSDNAAYQMLGLSNEKVFIINTSSKMVSPAKYVGWTYTDLANNFNTIFN